MSTVAHYVKLGRTKLLADAIAALQLRIKAGQMRKWYARPIRAAGEHYALPMLKAAKLYGGMATPLLWPVGGGQQLTHLHDNYHGYACPYGGYLNGMRAEQGR